MDIPFLILKYTVHNRLTQTESLIEKSRSGFLLIIKNLPKTIKVHQV